MRIRKEIETPVESKILEEMILKVAKDRGLTASFRPGFQSMTMFWGAPQKGVCSLKGGFLPAMQLSYHLGRSYWLDISSGLDVPFFTGLANRKYVEGFLDDLEHELKHNRWQYDVEEPINWC